MSNPDKIKEAYERNKRAIQLRSSVGQGTAKTTIRVRNGTTCMIESGSKKLICDIGEKEGGNDAGPGPGIYERSALGSCLAIGYAQQAALMDIPVFDIEVKVESDFDARAQFGLSDGPPGINAMRYTIKIDSPAPEEKVRKIIDKADARSPVLDDFRRPVPIERELIIESANTSKTL